MKTKDQPFLILNKISNCEYIFLNCYGRRSHLDISFEGLSFTNLGSIGLKDNRYRANMVNDRSKILLVNQGPRLEEFEFKKLSSFSTIEDYSLCYSILEYRGNGSLALLNGLFSYDFETLKIGNFQILDFANTKVLSSRLGEKYFGILVKSSYIDCLQVHSYKLASHLQSLKKEKINLAHWFSELSL